MISLRNGGVEKLMNIAGSSRACTTTGCIGSMKGQLRLFKDFPEVCLTFTCPKCGLTAISPRGTAVMDERALAADEEDEKIHQIAENLAKSIASQHKSDVPKVERMACERCHEPTGLKAESRIDGKRVCPRCIAEDNRTIGAAAPAMPPAKSECSTCTKTVPYLLWNQPTGTYLCRACYETFKKEVRKTETMMAVNEAATGEN